MLEAVTVFGVGGVVGLLILIAIILAIVYFIRHI